MSITYLACPLSVKEMQNTSIHKLCFLSIWSNSQIIEIEYPQGTCFHIFAVEDFSGLFMHPVNFLIKDSMSA